MTVTIFNFTVLALFSFYIGTLVGIMFVRELFDLHPGNKLFRQRRR